MVVNVAVTETEMGGGLFSGISAMIYIHTTITTHDHGLCFLVGGPDYLFLHTYFQINREP